MKTKPSPTQQERDFRIHELFFSTTDKKGVIRSGNDVFARVSGYPLAEMIEQPHNIIRHPDMPRAVFKLMWDYLKAGQSLVAYVKNMASDGAYYWVIALVTPLSDGFLSIRFKPSGPLFAAVQQIYQQLVTLERTHLGNGLKPKEVMEASQQKLEEILRDRGFASYDDLMHLALREELKSREALMRHSSEARPLFETSRTPEGGEGSVLVHLAEHSASIARTLEQLFARLDDFVLLSEKLENKVELISELAHSMRFLSLNTRVESSRLNTHSQIITTIADLMKENSQQIAANVTQIGNQLLDVVGTLKGIIYDLAGARLQLEMLRTFLAELIVKDESGTSDNTAAAQGSTLDRILALQWTFSQTYKRALAALLQFERRLQHLTTEGTQLQQPVKTLQIVHLVGRVEIARYAQLAGFGHILDEIFDRTRSTKTELDDLTSAITTLLARVSGLEKIDREVSNSLEQIAFSTRSLEI